VTEKTWTHSDEYCWPGSLCDACQKRLRRDEQVTVSGPPRQPCPKGGADHEPFPNGYLSASDYADLLMAEGWKQPHPCPRCGLWGVWTHPDGRSERPTWPQVMFW
jgi:hypothetical protein